jgi:cytochrome c556
MTKKVGSTRGGARTGFVAARHLVQALILVLLCAALLSCGPSDAEKAAAERKQCFLAQKEIAIEMAKVKRVKGTYPDVGNIVRQLHAECPAAGQYSFDGVSEKVSCSVHGVAR